MIADWIAMKTYHYIKTRSCRSGFTIRRFLGRVLAPIMVLGFMFAQVSAVRAGGADGAYRVTKVSGSFVVDGDTITVPSDMLKYAFLKNGRLFVEDNKVPIYRAKWSKLMDDFSYMGFTGSVKVTGPANLVLEKSGDAYVGSTSNPVVLKMTGDYMGTSISMVMKMNFKGKLVGDVLTITAPITVNAMDMVHMDGRVKIVTKR